MKGDVMRNAVAACGCAFLLLAAAGCEKGATAAGNADVGAAAGARASSPGAKVARIVFVDQVECCDCTRKRIDGSWAALQKALEGRSPAVPIERVPQDRESDKAESFRMMNPYMVVPAVYLLDGGGALVAQLQGEITVEQFKKALR